MSKKRLIDMTIDELQNFCISRSCAHCPLYVGICCGNESIYDLLFNKSIDKIELNVDERRMNND